MKLELFICTQCIHVHVHVYIKCKRNFYDIHCYGILKSR